MKFLKIGLVLLTLSLSGCAGTVHLEPAEGANTLACAELMVRLPDEVDGLSRRVVDAQSTAAWGDPASVLLRCGLPVAELSSLKCITEANVDWLVDDSAAPTYRFITFGRKPATEVIIDSKSAVGVNVIDAISAVVEEQEATAHCG